MSTRLVILFSVLFFIVVYTERKIVLAIKVNHLWGSFITLLFAGLVIGWQFFYRSSAFSQHTFFARALAWSTSCVMAVWATYLIFSLTCDVVFLVGKILSSLRAPASLTEERRAFLSTWIPASILGLSTGFVGVGLAQVLRGPKVVRVDVPIDGLPAELEGFQIAQISDLHVSATIGKAYVENVVNTTLSLNADVIAITGDLVDGKVDGLKDDVEPLSLLKAPCGVFYVTGNHEYYWGAQDWIDKVKQLGIEPLIDENRTVEKNGFKVLIAGVPDTSASKFIPSHESNPQRAIASTVATPAVKILLAHRPDSCDDAEKAGFQLQLSGHTHNGQFFPFNLLISFFHKYYRGLNRHGKMWVYVNVGTGYWGPATRLANPSEITLIRLVPSRSA